MSTTTRREFPAGAAAGLLAAGHAFSAGARTAQKIQNVTTQ
jgi:hypothetical protein